MPIITPQTTDEVPDVQVSHNLETPVIDNAEILSMSKVFGLESEKISPKEKEMLEECFYWAKKESSDNPMWALISKRNQLGTPITGESYLAKMYQWVRQYNIIQEEQEKLKELENV